MNYVEIEATPSSTGGRDGGKVHRVYTAQPTREDRRELMAGGWRPVDLTTGNYAHTALLKKALEVGYEGRVFVKQGV